MGSKLAGVKYFVPYGTKWLDEPMICYPYCVPDGTEGLDGPMIVTVLRA